MLRNRWLMPKFKENIITLKFLQGVKDGKIWSPKQQDTIRVQLAEPPPRQMIADEISAAVHGFVERG